MVDKSVSPSSISVLTIADCECMRKLVVNYPPGRKRSDTTVQIIDCCKMFKLSLYINVIRTITLIRI